MPHSIGPGAYSEMPFKRPFSKKNRIFFAISEKITNFEAGFPILLENPAKSLNIEDEKYP